RRTAAAVVPASTAQCLLFSVEIQLLDGHVERLFLLLPEDLDWDRCARLRRTDHLDELAAVRNGPAVVLDDHVARQDTCLRRSTVGGYLLYHRAHSGLEAAIPERVARNGDDLNTNATATHLALGQWRKQFPHGVGRHGEAN